MSFRSGRVISAAALVLAAVGLASAGAGASPRGGGTHSASPVLAAEHVLSYVPIRGSHSPRDTAFGNVDYNGGPVMPSNTDYLLFWSPSGYSAYGSGATPEYVSGLEQYFKDLAHDSGGHQNTDSVSTQYNDATGASVAYKVTLGGAILDTDAYPASKCPVSSPVTECMSDSQLQTEIEKVSKAHHLKGGLTHEYFLLLPPHVETCFTATAPSYGGCSAGEVPSSLGVFCAYHGNTTISPMLLYADDPYVTGNGGCDDGNHPNGPSDGALEGGLSHEHNESITDPIPNDAWTNGAGANQGSEIGDQCDGQMGATLGTAPNGAKYNQVIDGHFYWFQEEWSNQTHSCLQRFTLSGTEPVATFTATAGTGLSMTFNASGSSASGGVADYVWQFDDANGAQTVEVKTPSITHTFPSSGVYDVGLTVYAATGLSRGAGGIITTGQSGFTAGFTNSPAPTHGSPVTFHGLTTISLKSVKVYLWEFGDGSTGSGASPVHTYAAAGTYTVTLVMFSGVGSAFPGSGAAPIVTGTITVT